MLTGGGKAKRQRGEAATATHGGTERKAGSREGGARSENEIRRRDPEVEGEPQEGSVGERGVPEVGSRAQVCYPLRSSRGIYSQFPIDGGQIKLLLPCRRLVSVH